MKQIPLICAVVALVGCGGGDEEAAPKTQAKTDATPKAKATPKVEAKKSEPPKETPEKLIADLIVEKAIRDILDKPEGELTEADVAKVTELNLDDTEITDVGLKDLAKLQKLEMLYLGYTQITDAGLKDVAELKAAYSSAAVLNHRQRDALMQLLRQFATQLGAQANRILLKSRQAEPPLITRAKQYMTENLAESITLEDISKHLLFLQTIQETYGAPFHGLPRAPPH